MTGKVITIGVAAFICLAGTAYSQGTRHVDASAVDGGDGLSWATAYNDLQTALLAAAGSGGVVTEIRVADGTYRPAAPGGSRTATFALVNGVAVNGGYAGQGAPDPDARDPVTNPSILSGDLNADDGPNLTNRTENSFHVVTISAPASTCVLDGLTISAGYANAPGTLNAPDAQGGGCWILQSSPMFNNCTFIDNYGRSGGALRVESSSAAFTNCRFLENKSDRAGAGSFISGSPSFNQCLFQTNRSFDQAGGALNLSALTSATFVECVFVDNHSAGEGGAVFQTAGGTSHYQRCRFRLNSGSDGGAVNGDGLVENCLFAGNSGVRGSAIYGSFALVLRNSTIFGNQLTGNIGAVYAESIAAFNNIIWANKDNNGQITQAAQIATSGSLDADVRYNCISALSGQLGGEGNFSGDPLFVDAYGPDGIPGTIDDDLHLLPGSSCANAGSNELADDLSSDFEGHARIQQCRVDCGALESTLFADCNSNGQSDACEIASAASEDCNRDGRPDECASGTDCNSNGQMDSCDAYTLRRLFPRQSPFDGQHPAHFVLAVAPMASTDVSLTFVGLANFGEPRPQVALNGTNVAELLLSQGLPNCFHSGSATTIIARTVWNSAVSQGSGTVDISVSLGPTTPPCVTSYARVILTFVVNDCNSNGIPDDCDIAVGMSQDCNSDGRPDSCDPDCNSNGTSDSCDLFAGTSSDCNSNGVPDECDLSAPVVAQDWCANAQRVTTGVNYSGATTAANSDGSSSCANLSPDRWYKYIAVATGSLTLSTVSAQGTVEFSVHKACPGNAGNQIGCGFSTLTVAVRAGDEYRIRIAGQTGNFSITLSGVPGFTHDCNSNGVPDQCELTGNDCNSNGVPDTCEVPTHDCNQNGVIDTCDVVSGFSADCDSNRIPDECEVDCNSNGSPDACDVATGASPDCELNGIPDECQPDCDSDGIADSCEFLGGLAADCNANALPDNCDIAACPPGNVGCADCNGNGVPDACDVAAQSARIDPLDLYPIVAGARMDRWFDANGDGWPDLALLAASELDIFLNDGHGRFSAPVRYSISGDARAFVAADLDGDSDLDLAVARIGVRNVIVFINNGLGTFSVLATTHPVDGAPTSITAADFNGDGKLDLATCNTVGHNVSILLRNSVGSYDPSIPVPFNNVFFPSGIASGDIDGDGDWDITVSAESPFRMILLKNAGLNGGAQWLGFLPQVTVTISIEPASVILGDCDNDTDLDLIVAGSTSVLVLLNNGDGTFTSSTTYTVPNGARSPVLARFDGDSLPDIAVASSLFSRASILKNLGAGLFAPAVSYLVGSMPLWLDAADVDGDGDLDLALALDSGAAVELRRNGGDGNFSVIRYTAPVQTNPRGIVAADLDDDGALDLAVANLNSNSVSVLRSNRDGSFAPAMNFPANSGPSRITSADLDLDGKLDVIVPNGPAGSANTISILKNLGGGVLAAPVSYAVFSSLTDVKAGDLNGDGLPDVIVASGGTGDLYVLLQQPNGSFAAAVAFPSGTNTDSLFVGDLDGDSDLDVVAARTQTNAIAVYRNLGGVGASWQGLAGAVTYPASGSPHGVIGFDSDGDGDTDIAVFAGNSTVLFPNNGDTTFAAAATSGVGAFDRGVAVDLTRDGKLDIVASVSGDMAAVLANRGSNTFAVLGWIRMPTGPRDIAVLDANCDGLVDFATSNAGSNDVGIWLNRSDPPLLTDTNGNGIPDECEFTLTQEMMLNSLLLTGPPDCSLPADLNEDGLVNGTDIQLFVSQSTE